MREILINCDDLGMHSSINRAIIKILSQGIVTSASLMPSAPAFAEACQMLRALGQTRIGAHLALSAEYPNNPLLPVLGQAAVPTLCQPNGSFFPDVKEAAKGYSLSEIEQELRAQISLIQAQGLVISHLDGHMFFHHPEEGGNEIFGIFQHLAYELSLPCRFPLEQGGPREIKMLWDECESEEERDQYYSLLLNNTALSDYELIIHPADNVEQLKQFTKVGMRRFADYSFFTSQKFKDLILNNSWRVVAW